LPLVAGVQVRYNDASKAPSWLAGPHMGDLEHNVMFPGRTRMKPLVVSYVTLAVAAVAAQAANWAQWRSPTGNGVAEPGAYPVTFSATKNVQWKARLPGKGSSTPIVWGDRIFITCGIGKGRAGQDGVLCFDWSGKRLWQSKLGSQVPGRHRNGSGSCPSIVTDGTRLFAYFKSGTLAALDFEGKVLWKKDLQALYGKNTLWWDVGTSPVLAAGNVVVAVMHAGDSYVVAFEQATGKVAWKVARNFPCRRESDQSYTTPIVTTENGKTTLLIWGADHLTCHDPADGKTLWTCGGFNPDNRSMWRTIASASVTDGVAVVPYGRGRYLAGVKLGGAGEVTKTHRLWERRGIGADVPTPATADGKAYNLSDKGTVTCLAVKTGKTLWETVLPRKPGSFYSSPILVGDRLYACRDAGTVYVCQVSEAGLKVLAQNDMDDRLVATPVPVNGKLLIRGTAYLYCIGK